ncbi:hypothetical protein JCM10212_005977 [Sporobolomyces blumeae]
MPKTVLVTGASGFLASYVIDAFLSSGWTVHGTVRNVAKSGPLKQRYPDHADRLKFFEVKDIVTGDGLAQALEGCDAVAHTASPYQLTVSDPMKDFIEPAVEGTLSVLRAAKAAGIRRIVITSSFAAVTNFEKGGPWRDYTYTDKDWNPTTLEQACESGRIGAFVYSASKTLAEKAAHDYASKNGLSVTTLNPPMIYSPPLQSISSPEEINTSSNAIFSLINGEKGRAPMGNRLPLFCATEDVALAHVRALEVDEDKVKGRRFLLCGGSFTWEDAVRHLAQVHPELKDRLPTLPEQDVDGDKPIARLDCTPAREILGIDEFRNWKDTLERTIDRLVEVEKGFKK